MLTTIRQFNNSKRVCALYGMVLATLTLSCLIFAYAEHGEHGKTVKGWMVDGLLGMTTTVFPFTSDAVEMMYEFEQFKIECLDGNASFSGKELDLTITDSAPKC
ncbi:hypothetical protein AB8I23_004175 [Vibrio alginolyticus]|nr:hypothetical protein [Vibrio parahaemolyticus]EJC7127671.1 hypothetical protein [Vibrio parahaemolyticus]